MWKTATRKTPKSLDYDGWPEQVNDLQAVLSSPVLLLLCQLVLFFGLFRIIQAATMLLLLSFGIGLSPMSVDLPTSTRDLAQEAAGLPKSSVNIHAESTAKSSSSNEDSTG